MKNPLLRLGILAAALPIFSLIKTPSVLAEETPAQASLSVQGRATVFKHIMALRGKRSNESRIVVIASNQPFTAKQFEQVQKADAEETQNLDGYPSYIKASFKEDGTLRYLVGDGGGAVFSKKAEPSQTMLQGKATITGERVQGEVTLNEPGEYSKVATLKFDLPILKELTK